MHLTTALLSALLACAATAAASSQSASLADELEREIELEQHVGQDHFRHLLGKKTWAPTIVKSARADSSEPSYCDSATSDKYITELNKFYECTTPYDDETSPTTVSLAGCACLTPFRDCWNSVADKLPADNQLKKDMTAMIWVCKAVSQTATKASSATGASPSMLLAAAFASAAIGALFA